MSEEKEDKNKKRVLITIVGQGSINYFIRSGLIYKMKIFCEPVIALLWQQDDLMEELRSTGFEVHVIPEYEVSSEYVKLRAKINSWYLQNILKSVSTKIENSYISQFYSLKKRMKKRVDRFSERMQQFFFPKYIKKLILAEDVLLKEQACYGIFKEWIFELNIQGLFTATPFLQVAELLGRICKENGLPIIAAICSFDNVTKRGWQAIFFDHYIVWNKYNKAELQRINPAFKEDDISIAGAPQFDAHFNKSFGQAKCQWLQLLGLPVDKKIILYGGGPATLLPDEPQYLKHLKEAFENKLIKEDAVILFRSHPLDKLSRWKEYVGDSKYIFYDSAPNGKDKLDYTNVTLNDIDKLVSTLKYADVHINLCSTMAVDGSIFNRPQIAPYYDEVKPRHQRSLRRMYYQEHYLPIIKADAVQFAKSKNHLIELVNDTLLHPDNFNNGCTKCVEEIITYTDGNASERVASVLKTFFY